VIPIPVGSIATLFEKLVGWFVRRRAEKKMWALYRQLCAEQERNPARLLFRPDTDEELGQYQRMVEKGLLVRDLPGSFHLAGR
jgi:hypothetical protein